MPRKHAPDRPGFHGDKYLMEIMDLLLRGADAFVETGCNRGFTACHVAGRHDIPVYTCDVRKPAVDETIERAERLSLGSVHTHHKDSLAFLQHLHDELPTEALVVYHLDAHGPRNEEWIVPKELAEIVSTRGKAVILVDDVQVPGKPQFQNNVCKGVPYTHDIIKEAVFETAKKNGRMLPFRFWQPGYEDKTSWFHPLVGWELITYGVGSITRQLRGRADVAERS
tara:strand:+ start:196 stop:870 length:675 start_codon:yes stop_codon:yes gene_type:complete